MANCNDCICSEVCYYKSFNDVRTLKKRRNDVEKICKSFVYRDRVKGVEIDQFKKCPTVDAVPVVRGQWVDRYGGKYDNQLFECSACKRKALCEVKVDALGHEHIVQVLSDFCPHCGTDMRGDDNDI